MTSKLRIVLAGGSGHVGTILARHFHAGGHAVTVLSRNPKPAPWATAAWDGLSPGAWTFALEGADVLINLTGRSVNCRYTEANRREIMDSRVGSTRLLGQVINQLARPPRLWINASTATIYRHSFDREMDETTGEVGGTEADAPLSWRFSIEVATKWEEAFFSCANPRTRKVALRSAMVMSPERGGIFEILLRLVRFGLGGRAGSGTQFVSWVHEDDFVRAVDYLIAHEELRGAVNVCSPKPLSNADFMQALRAGWGAKLGLPATRWMLAVGAVLLRTETELILKSRRVVPETLLFSGFQFQLPDWPHAAQDLVHRWRALHNAPHEKRDPALVTSRS